ncbi:hypothetical protein PoB_007642600 [Plakobranchus ocellatus]|uniref:Uncharacterized protein n=1 Tax=Plakobranchus ocellatus TaxID=259542 RepID=A0AAV4E1F8_9GAST|nr:hypothetical protein PoB_007642600 [Plakobranchus ocellatus]
MEQRAILCTKLNRIGPSSDGMVEHSICGQAGPGKRSLSPSEQTPLQYALRPDDQGMTGQGRKLIADWSTGRLWRRTLFRVSGCSLHVPTLAICFKVVVLGSDLCPDLPSRASEDGETRGLRLKTCRGFGLPLSDVTPCLLTRRAASGDTRQNPS